MKQLAQYQDGRLEIQEVPAPQVLPGGILVRTTHSVISPGTEKMKVQQANMNLLQKARARPDQVKKVLQTARTLGWQAAYDKVKNRLETPTPLGYSAAGEVLAVDDANTRFRVGDRVAVAGNSCAFHAEIVAIPDLLAARVPEGVDNRFAAFTTLAAIAMHGVRQSSASVGDRVLVMGQGLVGLLTTAVLKASGARVLAVDLDSHRLNAATEMGADVVVDGSSGTLADCVRTWSEGYGVDAALICTAGSNKPVEQAVDALRDRGVITIVGMTDAQLDWKALYHKEIEVRYSRSYGPGRYDPAYESRGRDYPIGYVRWTEQRNFQACLELMRSGALNLEPVISRDLPFDDCLAAYDDLQQATTSDIGVVLHYGNLHGGDLRDGEEATAGLEVGSGGAEQSGIAQGRSHASSECKPGVRGASQNRRRLSKPITALDVVGAGNFVKTMLLPHLKDQAPLGTVTTQTALSAAHVMKKFGFQSAETDWRRALELPGQRAMLIGTRHDLHAPMVIAALEADRHVFVEKPLCLTSEELHQIEDAYESSAGSVMVGFNRRFAPATQELVRRIQNVPGPRTMAFHVHAGQLDPESWYANVEESGGRILGEACHFADFLAYVLGSKPTRVAAQPIWPTSSQIAIPDSMAAQIEFEDGSCGQLIYSAEGDHSYPKEVFTLYAAGLVARCENFRKLQIHYRGKRTASQFNSKGHAEEMAAWSRFLEADVDPPHPFSQSCESMRLTFAILESLRQGASISLR